MGENTCMSYIWEGANIQKKYGNFPGGSDGKESAWNSGDPGLAPG